MCTNAGCCAFDSAYIFSAASSCTPRFGFALFLALSHKLSRLRLRVVPRSSAKPLGHAWDMAFVFPRLSTTSADAGKDDYKVEYVAYLVFSEGQI